MSKILLIIPDETLLPFAQTVLAANYPDIEVAAAVGQEGVKLVQDRISRGLEVVAARSMTAAALRQAGLNIAVVEIPRTSFDIIRALDKTKSQGKRVAFISYSEKIWGIELLTDSIGINFRQYTVSYKRDFAKEILLACADGAEIILGGFTVVQTARRLNVPCALIEIGQESLLQAAREAGQILDALEADAAKRGFFGTVLDYANEGIVTIDRDGMITGFNPVAQKLTRIQAETALARSIDKILPQLRLSQIIHSGKEELHHIVEIGAEKIICNKVPIIVNQKVFGAVATFKEISEIQKMEAAIRKKIYSRGHVAQASFASIIGRSAAIQAAIETAKDFANTNSNVLIWGETGTGKEIFAQSIHNASQRARGPFVAINCAALPAQILESELFGYVGGAFTGANKEGKPGLFEVAHGGTIFLDEIAEMDYVNQSRLLRFLQEKTVVRLGSYNVLPIDVRVIAATNKDLHDLVLENKFRADLYFRLNVLNLELPPLRARKEDIRLFAETFLDDLTQPVHKKFRFAADAIQFLAHYAWPGNIRECRNLMERISATCKTEVVTGDFLSTLINKKTLMPVSSLKESLLIQQTRNALAACQGNCQLAAELLGINRTTLWRRMKKYQLG